ncbi:MAG: tetratricopeptide repeat protein, partial [Thermoanaerobaculia bacterium]
MRFRPAVPVLVLALSAFAALAVPAAPREAAAGREPEGGGAGAEETTPVPELVAAAERAISQGRAEEAAALYRRAVDAQPEAPRLVAALGRSLALADRYGESADVLERAVALGASDARTRFYLGSALWESGRYDEAEAALRRAAEEAAGSGAEPVVRQQLGRLLLWV